MNTKEKAQAIANFYQELADNDNGFTYESTQVDYMPGPNLDTVDACIKYWKVNPPKPKLKTIDLSMMVGSGVDVELKNLTRVWWVTKLAKIKNGMVQKYVSNLGDGYMSDSCRIRQNHWYSWQGGECPLPEGLEIEIQTRQSSATSKTIYYLSECWGWFWNSPLGDNDGDIIAFKVIGPAEGYKYAWE